RYVVVGTDTERYSNESDRGGGPGRRNGRDEAGRAARAAGGEARQPLGREPGGGRRRADLRRVGGASAGRRHGGYRPAVRVLLRTGHLVPPPTGRTPTRSGGRNSQSSAPAPASGRGSTSRRWPS